MVYTVKEIFYSLQGEGARVGRAAVFCRFSGCNLWSGIEEKRALAQCQFCDTDFVGINGHNGGKYETAHALAQKIQECWQGDNGTPYVIFTGGEPALQLDDLLLKEVKKIGFEIAIETNGTYPISPLIDWICVSPKTSLSLIKQNYGDELKFPFPQKHITPELFSYLDFKYFWIQPIDDNHHKNYIIDSVHYCKKHPLWRLSLQTHKFIGIS